MQLLGILGGEIPFQQFKKLPFLFFSDLEMFHGCDQMRWLGLPMISFSAFRPRKMLIFTWASLRPVISPISWYEWPS